MIVLVVTQQCLEWRKVKMCDKDSAGIITGQINPHMGKKPVKLDGAASGCFGAKLGPEGRHTEEFERINVNVETAPKCAREEGKPRPSLIPMDILIEFLVPAYEEGLIKYEKESWRRGFKISELMDAVDRHKSAFFHERKDLDETAMSEYGIEKHHLAGAIFSLIAALHTLKYHPELDDRHEKSYGDSPDNPELDIRQQHEAMLEALSCGDMSSTRDTHQDIFTGKIFKNIGDIKFFTGKRPESPNHMSLDECVDIINDTITGSGISVNDSLKIALETLENRSWK